MVYAFHFTQTGAVRHTQLRPPTTPHTSALSPGFSTLPIHTPFSVHRMALAGKDLGTQVGQWFGPSIAAGAIKYVSFHIV